MLTLRPFSRRIVAGGYCPIRSYHCYFHCALEFATPILAHMLDSLVRVSRRGKENHFDNMNINWHSNTPSIWRDISAHWHPLWPMHAHSAPAKRQRKYKREQHWFPLLPFQQFQVLFNSLFKVLCIFPSRYLFAIGLPRVFSFRWNLPPSLSCNPKQLDSLKTTI